jgi:hypothetical protein
MSMFSEAQPLDRASLYNDGGVLETDLLVIAAPSAEKWRANLDPKADLDSIERLGSALASRIRAKRVVHFSTVDVYGSNPKNDESAPPVPDNPYGLHRLRLTEMLRNAFSSVQEVRLPGLYGSHLKKNLLFDIRSERWDQLASVNPESRFQFAEISWAIATASMDEYQSYDVLNIAVEPVCVAELPSSELWLHHTSPEAHKVDYQMRSLATQSGFMLSKRQVISSIAKWNTQGGANDWR